MRNISLDSQSTFATQVKCHGENERRGNGRVISCIIGSPSPLFLPFFPPAPLSIVMIQMAFSKCTCAYYLDELHLPHSEV